jgi:multidrug efflux system membrane fusion protein
MDDFATNRLRKTNLRKSGQEHSAEAGSADSARSSRRFSRLGRRLGGALLLLALVALAWWIEQSPAQQHTRGRLADAGPVPVVAATVRKGNIDITLDALGTAVPLATVLVKSQISGQLVHVDFQEGQTVKKGDLLAEIDSRPYELALKQAQGQIARDQAMLQGAELDLGRYKSLIASNAIARQQLDTTQAQVKQDEGTIAADEAQIGNANLNIAYCHIRAPVDGRVGLRLVDQGNYVAPSDSNGIVLITQLQPITVIFTVPEDDLPAILKRLHAGATLPVTAFDRSGTTELAHGTLTTLDNEIDATTGTVKLRALFANQDETLFPNQFVNVRLLVDQLQNVPVASLSAVQRGAPGSFVYLINADNTVSVRPIELGPSNGDKVAVKAGLSANDRIVVDGTDRLREGASIVARTAETGVTAETSVGRAGTESQSARHPQGGS